MKYSRQNVPGHVLHDEEGGLARLPRHVRALQDQEHLLEAADRADDEDHVLDDFRHLEAEVLRKRRRKE